jgi:hypothetical protein
MGSWGAEFDEDLDWSRSRRGEVEAEEMRDMAEESVGMVRVGEEHGEVGDVGSDKERFGKEKGKGKMCLFKSDLERDLV